jgi:hypothetical protein
MVHDQSSTGLQLACFWYTSKKSQIELWLTYAVDFILTDRTDKNVLHINIWAAKM